MSLDRLFDTIERARDASQWRAAFGEPQVVDDKTIIPVSRAHYAFGLGFGSGAGPSESEDEPAPESEGGGGGGTGSAKPLGAIVITPDQVYFEPIRDDSKIALVALGMVVVNVWQIGKTLRAIFGK